MADNFTRYKEALKARYVEIKDVNHSNFLLDLTWAKLRNLCLLVYRDNHNDNDCKTFELLFGFKPEESTKKKMADQTNKFRPLVTFLRNETELSDIVGADLIAVLLDYEHRPYNKFVNLKEDTIKTNDIIENNEEVVIEDKVIKENEVIISDEENVKDKEKLPIDWKKIMLVALLICMIGLIGFVSYTAFFSNKKCMQWQTNHYEIISCDEKMEMGKNGIEAYSDALLLFRKIIPDSTIEPFKNGKPNLWTGRGPSGAIEYFNGPGTGKHPVTYVELKPITHGRAKKLVDEYHK